MIVTSAVSPHGIESQHPAGDKKKLPGQPKSGILYKKKNLIKQAAEKKNVKWVF